MALFTLILYVSLIITLYICAYLDNRKKRVVWPLPALSFLIPCYNDADSVTATIQSIYHVCHDMQIDVVVINDASTDASSQVLHDLRDKYQFHLIENAVNLGKVQSLNNAVHYLQSDIIFFVDADVMINRKAVEDIIARFARDSHVGAVSCPYRARNKGFRPAMQGVEYNMLALIQWSYNISSAISLWGGCLAVRKDAFLQAGKFSLHAITEDMDLAFKLNVHKRRVQQSFVPISTIVPQTFQERYKQKMRRNTWGMQAFLTYVAVWIKNPLHVIFIVIFNIFIVYSVYRLSHTILSIYSIWDILTFKLLWSFLQNILHTDLWIQIVQKGAFTLLSLPYVLPLIHRKQEWYKIFLLIPFSLVYVPLYSAMGVIAAFVGIKRYYSLKPWVRAW